VKPRWVWPRFDRATARRAVRIGWVVVRLFVVWFFYGVMRDNSAYPHRAFLEHPASWDVPGLLEVALVLGLGTLLGLRVLRSALSVACLAMAVHTLVAMAQISFGWAMLAHLPILTLLFHAAAPGVAALAWGTFVLVLVGLWRAPLLIEDRVLIGLFVFGLVLQVPAFRFYQQPPIRAQVVLAQPGVELFLAAPVQPEDGRGSTAPAQPEDGGGSTASVPAEEPAAPASSAASVTATRPAAGTLGLDRRDAVHLRTLAFAADAVYFSLGDPHGTANDPQAREHAALLRHSLTDGKEHLLRGAVAKEFALDPARHRVLTGEYLTGQLWALDAETLLPQARTQLDGLIVSLDVAPATGAVGVATEVPPSLELLDAGLVRRARFFYIRDGGCGPGTGANGVRAVDGGARWATILYGCSTGLILHDGEDLHVLARAKTASDVPWAISIDPARRRIYVGYMDAPWIEEFAADDLSLTARYAAPRGIRGLLALPDSPLLIAAGYFDGRVLVIDRDSGARLRTLAMPPKSYGLAAAAGYVYVAGPGGVFRFALDPTPQ